MTSVGSINKCCSLLFIICGRDIAAVSRKDSLCHFVILAIPAAGSKK